MAIFRDEALAAELANGRGCLTIFLSDGRSLA
jgi:hypothetical protein